MQKKNSTLQESRFGGAKDSFTLVEMMVVLVIIVILATMILPVVFRARDRALKRQAQTEANTLVLAVKAYRSVFGKWPAQTNARDQWYFTNNHLVVTQLMGGNPRQRSFISIAATNLDSYSNYLDPKGVPYVICIIQSGGRAQIFNSITNEYTCEREANPHYGVAVNYILNFTNNVTVGVGSFMENTDVLAVNSWSDF